MNKATWLLFSFSSTIGGLLYTLFFILHFRNNFNNKILFQKQGLCIASLPPAGGEVWRGCFL